MRIDIINLISNILSFLMFLLMMKNIINYKIAEFHNQIVSCNILLNKTNLYHILSYQILSLQIKFRFKKSNKRNYLKYIQNLYRKRVKFLINNLYLLVKMLSVKSYYLKNLKSILRIKALIIYKPIKL